ncbi:radical SAM protein [Clostridiales bacterium F-3ap]|uniref:Radical SAM protein n=1 Tax=Anaerotalea alkaliphila TaxID=2662126 RepID=A0A7X5KPP3_9FIRM|nr:radical SAM protein [Anaerotalea alkaliphila]
MKIGLIDFDGKIPNLALMKLSAYYKAMGCQVEIAEPQKHYDKVYCSVLFTWNRGKAEKLADEHKDIEFGGTGWDIHKTLPDEIESCRPDYDLYSAHYLEKRTKGIMTRDAKIKKVDALLNMGIGFTSRGCIRSCRFCFVPLKEGTFRQVGEIKDIINPRSNVITMLDNNFTADPLMIEKCQEIKERGLIVDLTQGIDVRLITDEKAKALAEINHLRSVHYAWDLMKHEDSIFKGIAQLSKQIKPYKHLCFMLVGFDTTFEEDMYRLWKIHELKVSPYVMVYNKNQKNDIRLKHFARWVNSRIYKVCSFDKYEPWVKDKNEQMSLFV